VHSYKPSSLTERYELVGARKSLKEVRANCSSAWFNSSKDCRKCTSIKSPLCPSREYSPDCPDALCSIFASAVLASLTISFFSAVETSRHAGQRTRIIWCSTL